MAVRVIATRGGEETQRSAVIIKYKPIHPNSFSFEVCFEKLQIIRGSGCSGDTEHHTTDQCGCEFHIKVVILNEHLSLVLAISWEEFFVISLFALVEFRCR